jgi:hypothetical protein
MIAPAAGVALPIEDLQDVAPDERENEPGGAGARRAPFDLRRGP